MLPTKGYFHDIQCPYFNSMCGRPYCHFRHRKKANETPDESIAETEKTPVPVVPTYKPTPKSELENIHNSKSHIPISYVPDLAFRPDRTTRKIPKFDKPTYKPTPLSVLSSAKNRGNSINDEENGEDNENTETIKEIKQNMANVAYNPLLSLQETSEIDFEDLSNEFSLIDEIIYDSKMASNETNGNTQSEDKSVDTKEEITNEEIKSKSKSSDKRRKDSDSSKSNRHSSKSKHSSSKEKNHSSSHKKSSSRDKHRKEEKKDSSSKHSHKSSHRSKEKKSSDKEKKHHSSRNKERTKEKEKEAIKEKELTNPVENHEYELSDEDMMAPTDFDDHNLSDLDEDATLMECYKIFNEYKPEPKQEHDTKIEEQPPKPDSTVEQLNLGKKRVAHTNPNSVTTKLPHVINKPKSYSNPGQVMTNRFKLAKLAQANKEQDNLVNEMKQITSNPVKRPPPSLLEAARQHKIKRIAHTPPSAQPDKSVSLVDQILNGTTSKAKKIAPVQNVPAMQRAKARIEQMAKKKAASVVNKTIAHSQKGSRVAHVPDFSLSDIPDVLEANKSKLPVNVRTRYLTMLADECVKLYVSKDDAYTRALNEEFGCYEKSKLIQTYRNSAMLAVNRLRKEMKERERLGLGLLDTNEDPKKKLSPFHGKNFYDNVKRWILSEEEMDVHGYPRESDIHGRAFIKNRKSIVDNLDENQRKCARCSKVYVVDDDGWPLYEEGCIYHPLKKRTIRGEQIYLCCKSSSETGCATSDTHVCEFSTVADLEGFQVTMPPNDENDPRNCVVYALDCEMCYTTKGLELTRVTIVDTDCKTVYESLVKPLNPIIDYNTRFSGITKEQMDKTSTSILQIQANILHLCNSQTILVGHSLESDLKVLKIVHKSIIDTSVLFPHKMGLPHKRALRVLASEYLKKIIQNDVGGHDSAEDAITCMELIKWKLKEELKLK